VRIRVAKPKDGVTDIVIDDRSGVTGLFRVAREVEVRGIPAVVGPHIDAWHRARQEFYALRKQNRG